MGGAIAAGAWVGLGVLPSPLPIALAAGALLAAAGALRLRGRPWMRAGAFLSLGGLTGFGAGLAADKGLPSEPVNEAVELSAPVRFAGTVAEPLNRRLAPPRWKSSTEQPRLTLLIDVDSIELRGGWRPVHARVLLGAQDVPLEAGVGDAVEGSARFLSLQAPSNPGEPDQRPGLHRRGIAYLGALEKGALGVTRASTGIERRAERFREAFTSFVRGILGDGDRAALVAALAVGERSGVSVGLADAFNTSGLAHILSISGLHLAVAVLVLAWVLRRLFALSASLSNRLAPRRLAALVVLPLTAGYVVLIGAPAPAVRAGLGLGMLLIGAALGRDPDVLNTLGWSLGTIALFDPPSLDDPSTQLSFMGVLGLVAFTGRLRALVPLRPPDPLAPGWTLRWQRAREAVLLLGLGSIAATLATAPITASCFERASLVAALSNVVAWPASTFIVPAGALAAALFPVSPLLATPFVHLAGYCAAALALCARFFAAWPAAALRVAPPSLTAIAAYYLVILGLMQLRERPRHAWAILATASLIFAVAWWPRSWPEGIMEVTFLSVGQGDSTVVRFPHGSTMVLDAGGEVTQRFDPGAAIVAPFLRSEGIHRIDLLVASHPHPDHIAGMPSLLERFRIGELWENGDGALEGPLAALIAEARDVGAPVTEFRVGLPDACAGKPPLGTALPEVASLAVGDPRCTDHFPERSIDGVRIQILHPLNGPDRSAFPELGQNDNSLVLRLTYGNVHVLLPGDVEHEGEALVLGRGVDISADIEKAPHHGSRTSSTPEFIRAVHPKYVVFCVGEHNQFGFPAPEIEQRYEAAGCRRFRTDQDGAVTFTTDGRSISVKPFKTGN